MTRNAAGYLCLQASGRVYLTIIPYVSERIEPVQQVHLAFPSRQFAGPSGRIYFLQSLAFGFQAGLGVDVCRVETLVPEPVANHCYVDPYRYFDCTEATEFLYLAAERRTCNTTSCEVRST